MALVSLIIQPRTDSSRQMSSIVPESNRHFFCVTSNSPTSSLHRSSFFFFTKFIIINQTWEQNQIFKPAMPCPYSEVFSDFPEVAVTWTHNTFRSYCALLRFFLTTFIETAEDKCQYRTLISTLVLYKRPIHDITSKIRRQYSPHDYRLKIDWSIDRSITD